MARIAASIAIMMAVLITPAQARGFGPGQWGISEPSIQQICIVSDGTWYGTTYNWNGHWMYSSQKAGAVIFGNYAVNNQPFGYGNDTMTLIRGSGNLGVAWQDWFDDESYTFFGGAIGLFKIKAKCDKPYTGNNTQAPSQ